MGGRNAPLRAGGVAGRNLGRRAYNNANAHTCTCTTRLGGTGWHAGAR